MSCFNDSTLQSVSSAIQTRESDQHEITKWVSSPKQDFIFDGEVRKLKPENPNFSRNPGDWDMMRLRLANKTREKVINDCIHGTIAMPLLAMKIMDTWQFQRLKKIKQTGTCHFVYPNATHNRFQHSVGVAHLAQKYAKHLREKYPDLLDDKDILCVLLAGLCHDLGHGPFSHLWESFIKEAEPESEFEHEMLSIKMLDRLLEENKETLQPYLEECEITEKDIVFIKELIVGPLDSETGMPSKTLSAHDQTWPYRGRGEEKSFLYEIVANKLTGIDVDKWDYFMRDDYYLNIGHVFDYQRFMVFTRIEKTGNPLRRRLVMRDKERENLLIMFKDRKRLHLHGYQHRVTKICDRMLLDVLIAANSFVKVKGSDGKLFSLSRASLEDITAHEKLTDEFVETLIMLENDERLEAAREILQRLRSRNLYRCVLTAERDDSKDTDVFKSKKEAMRSLSDFIETSGYSKELTASIDLCIVLRDYKHVKEDPEKMMFYFYDISGLVHEVSASTFLVNAQQKTLFIICKNKLKRQLAKQVVEEWATRIDITGNSR